MREQLAYIQTSYQQMDDLLEEIDRRNASYAKASFEYVRYLLSDAGDTEGKLVALLRFLGSGLREGRLNEGAPWPEQWAGTFDLYTQQSCEDGSLFTPRAARRRMSPQPLAAPTATAADREKARAHLRHRLAAKLTYARIDEYLQQRLASRSELRAADLGVETVTDFVRLIYVAAYGNHRRVCYSVDLQGDQVSTAGGRFTFKNIRIRRK